MLNIPPAFPVLTDIVDRVLANCLGIVYMETHNCRILGQRAIDLDILLSQHDQHKYFPFLPVSLNTLVAPDVVARSVRPTAKLEFNCFRWTLQVYVHIYMCVYVCRFYVLSSILYTTPAFSGSSGLYRTCIDPATSKLGGIICPSERV